ncbi:MAG: TonB-dependent receptor [Bryobacteraceae bacterium]
MPVLNASGALKRLAAGIFLLSVVSAPGQIVATGSVEGLVRDPANAAVAGVTLKLTNVQTGVSTATVSNGAGYYTFPAVRAGLYQVEASLQGFRRVLNEFTVQTAVKTTVDIQLELGEVTQSVEVTANVPVLETASASLSTVVTNRQVTDLPLAGRNPYMLILLSPGVIQTRNPGPSAMNDISGSSYFSTNGANMRMNGFTMDGVMNTVSDRVAYVPPVDQVEEFNVQTNTFDAEYGYAAGAFVNVVTKSGTNGLHGSAYEFLRNSALNANQFFANSRGIPKPTFQFNQFGAAVGGPALPNRTFWFFNYEGIRETRPSTAIGTVPTALERSGDFSQTRDAGGRLVGIYDPFSTRPSGNGFIRDAFPNNRIPAARMDPAARSMFDTLIPQPNGPGDPLTATNNLARTLVGSTPMDSYSLRIDHNFSSNHQLFGRWSQAKTSSESDYFIDVGGKNRNNRVQTSVAAGDTIVFSPSTLLTINGGFTRWTQQGIQPDNDLGQFGFPAALINRMQQQKVPRINNTDMVFFGAIEGSWFEHTNTWTYSVNLRHTQGRHAMKMGFQSIIKQNNSQGANQPMGQFSFDRAFTQGPDPTSRGSAIGYGTASYLLGTPASGNITLNSSGATNSPFYGWFFQDDIRLSSRLTLNVGLRYEVLLPATERYNRSTVGFAYDSANPIEAAAKAAYARNPIPELSPDQFRVLGGLLFATPDNRQNGITDKNNWSPRIGVAYKITDKTVFRAGFGRFHSYWWAPFTRDTGFSSQTPFISSLGEFRPADVLSNPFPNGFAEPIGSSQGLATLLGTSISFYDQSRRQGYNDRISAGFQHELRRDFRLEANYVGQWASQLPVGSSGSGVTPSSPREQDRELRFLSAQHLGLRNRLFERAPNPFFGLISTGELAAPTITVQNLLSSYPHFTGATATRQTIGTSKYHSLQVTAMKRYSSGIQLLSAYTFSKSLEKVRYINVNDADPSQTIGEFDRPHRVTLGAIAELPFGPGKPWGPRSGLEGKLIGGWQVNAIYTFQSGEALPLDVGLLSTGQDPRLSPGERSVDGWFNPNAFQVLPQFSLRDLSYTLSRLRGDGINNWDLSVIKDTQATERLKVQFRWELYNAFNRAQFSRPNLNPTSGGYTRITGTVATPREMQFGLKLIF